MSSILKILRRIGGTKVTPTAGEEGQLAIWKADKTVTGATSLFFHDGSQWVELFDTAMMALRNVVNTFTASQVIDVTDTKPALRITQKGTGAALLVEDEANPDASPFVVDGSGNVGIGTATPSRQFVVSDAGGPGFEVTAIGGTAALLAFDRKASAEIPMTISAKSFSFETKAVGRLNIAEDGNVGIGSGAVTSRVFILSTAAYPALTIRQDGNAPVQVWQGLGAAEVMRLDHVGNLGVGNIDPVDCRLRIKGETADSVKHAIIAANTSNQDLFKVRNDGAMYAGTAPKSPINLTTAAAANLYVEPTNGILQRSTSSLRYKRDVVDYDKGLDAVKALRPVYYKQKATDIDGEPVNTQYAGLIAEEVDAAGLHEFVAYDSQGRPDALQYANMVALLVKAVQELSAKVEKLEARP